MDSDVGDDLLLSVRQQLTTPPRSNLDAQGTIGEILDLVDEVLQRGVPLEPGRRVARGVGQSEHDRIGGPTSLVGTSPGRDATGSGDG